MMEYYEIAIIPLIIGLVEVLKRIGLPKKLTPLASLILGIAAGIYYIYPEDIKKGILIGVMVGLSASGLYSGTKNTIENHSNHTK